jgi:RimJ/RimL family protein N-acetyltransferase
MTLSVRPLTDKDLAFLQQVRNHPETVGFLHDQRTFTYEETTVWFIVNQPKWYIIEKDAEPVGYWRTSDLDERNKTLKVGLDLHPDHRGLNISKDSFPLFLAIVERQGIERIWLEVLPNNLRAFNLYRTLGFEKEGTLKGSLKRGNRREDSVVMGRPVTPDTGKNVKVISAYLGPRRGSPKSRYDCYDMYAHLLEQELTLDPGCPCDTLIIHSQHNLEANYWTKATEDLLKSVNGAKTPRGEILVLEKENIGISFGAFNHAFTKYWQRYDHWFFIEDDQIIVKPGVYQKALEQLALDNTIGYVCAVGASLYVDAVRHAHGGVGVTTRSILREIFRKNPSTYHPEGHLPYHWESGYAGQVHYGEIRFTNGIDKAGYRLVDHAWNDICLSWGDPGQRTPRMVPWEEGLSKTSRFYKEPTPEGQVSWQLPLSEQHL